MPVFPRKAARRVQLATFQQQQGAVLVPLASHTKPLRLGLPLASVARRTPIFRAPRVPVAQPQLHTASQAAQAYQHVVVSGPFD